MLLREAGHSSRRTGRVVFWLVGALLLVFGGLIAYQMLFAARDRFKGDEALLDELQGAGREEAPEAKLALPWPQWRGPNRDGFVRCDNLRTDWPEGGPPVAWEAAGGGGYSSFAVGGGRLYTLLAPSESEEALVCWDAIKGKELWRHTYASRGFAYPGPRSTPTLDDSGKLIYALSSRGRLMCLTAKDGKVKWEVDFLAELQAPIAQWGFACSPLVDGKWVYAITGARGKAVAAFDRFTGKLAWGAQDGPTGYSSPILAMLAGTRQLVCFLGDRLVGLAPGNGELLWQFPWATKFEVNAATPLIVHRGTAQAPLDYVFVSSGYDKGSALVKIQKDGGAFTARAAYETNVFCCHFASPVRCGDYLYGPDEKRDLTCLDLRTGKVQWRRRGFGKGSVLRLNDYLLVFGDDGRLALAPASPEHFAPVARARPFKTKPCWASPAFAEGLLYLRDESRVLCLDLRKP